MRAAAADIVERRGRAVRRSVLHRQQRAQLKKASFVYYVWRKQMKALREGRPILEGQQ